MWVIDPSVSQQIEVVHLGNVEWWVSGPLPSSLMLGVSSRAGRGLVPVHGFIHDVRWVGQIKYLKLKNRVISLIYMFLGCLQSKWQLKCLLCFDSDSDTSLFKSFSCRIFPIIWFIKLPLSLFLKIGCGVKPGVTMNPNKEPKQLIWYESVFYFFSFVFEQLRKCSNRNSFLFYKWNSTLLLSLLFTVILLNWQV